MTWDPSGASQGLRGGWRNWTNYPQRFRYPTRRAFIKAVLDAMGTEFDGMCHQYEPGEVIPVPRSFFR